MATWRRKTNLNRKGTGGRSPAAPLPARVYWHFLPTGRRSCSQSLSDPNPKLAPEITPWRAPEQANFAPETRGFRVLPTKFREYLTFSRASLHDHQVGATWDGATQDRAASAFPLERPVSAPACLGTSGCSAPNSKAGPTVLTAPLAPRPPRWSRAHSLAAAAAPPSGTRRASPDLVAIRACLRAKAPAAKALRSRTTIANVLKR